LEWISRGGLEIMVLQYVGSMLIDVPTPAEIAARTATSTGTYDGTEKVSYTVAKEFNVSKSLLTINTDSSASTNSVIVKGTGISTTNSYFAFGTTMFFKATVNDTKQAGGFGFFLAPDTRPNSAGTINGATGYYVSIATTSTAAAQGGNSFNFYKVINGKKYVLQDSQSVSDAAKLRGIYNGSSYKIDVFVKYGETKTSITAYINGFKITATDITKNIDGVSVERLSKTNVIALYANVGTVAFDYAYAMPITSAQHDSATLYNIYKQNFASAGIDMAYGDMFVSGLQQTDSATASKYIDEFGPVAREIRNIKTRYDSSPAIPKYITTGLNQAVSVLGHKLGVFTGEAYVLNNTGTYVPLSDGAMTSFAIIGPTISKSSPIEYMDTEIDKYSPQEPVTFDSQWIQRESDAKNLSDWIKKQWKNKQRTIEINTFGQPLVSVCDIIVVDYPYNDLSTAQKFVVTNVTQSWKDGLTTTITARSIYS
jgi:hypothetical protein